MSEQTEALKLALEALNRNDYLGWQTNIHVREAIREALDEQPAQDNTYNYAKSLAEAIFKQHFASDEHYASGRIVWGVNDTVIGILTQIDNMVADMVRRPAQQQEPVAWRELCRRLYFELYWCDRQMKETLDKDGEPMWTQGKTVRDVLADAKAALETSPQPSKPLTDEQIQYAFRTNSVVIDDGNAYMVAGKRAINITRAIEAAHGIKGSA